MNDNLKEEIETLQAVYNEDELTIDDKSEGMVSIVYLTKLDRHCAIKIQFCIKKNTSISVVNDDSAKKLIPSQTLAQIEQILREKYHSEGEYMPIFQCISFCNDELLEDEALNLSSKLKSIPLKLITKTGGDTRGSSDDDNEEMTFAKQRNINKKDYFKMNKPQYRNNRANDFKSYVHEMNKFSKEHESATIKNVGNDKLNAMDKDKNNDHKNKNNDDEKIDNLMMGTWARYSLKQIDIRLWNATPTVNQIRSLLKKKNKKIKPENYNIDFIAKHEIIQRFLNNVEYGAVPCKYAVVYQDLSVYYSDNYYGHKRARDKTQDVIDNGFKLKAMHQLNCSSEVPIYCDSDALIFLCIIRVKNCDKIDKGYGVKNGADIVPIYLLKFHAQKKQI